MDIESMDKTMVEIENALRQRICGQNDGEILWSMVQYGKRLRPLLCVLSFKACGGINGNYGEALDVAAAVELGHCASLCHDDIVDKDFTRRGHPAFWVENGISEALITGHRAISLGLQVSLSHGAEIAETFLEAWDRALIGGSMEAEARRNRRISTVEYMKIIEYKTASLFAAATKVGSQIARAPHDIQNLMSEYGMAVGVAYQLADDLSELHENKEGELSSIVEWSKVKNSAASISEYLIGEMKAAIEKAEELSLDKRLPASKFKPLLGQVPKYFTELILGNVVLS